MLPIHFMLNRFSSITNYVTGWNPVFDEADTEDLVDHLLVCRSEPYWQDVISDKKKMATPGQEYESNVWY